MRPLIGITQCIDDRGRWRPGRTYGYLETSYAEAVERAGGTPLLIPLQHEAAPVVGRIDGLLLPGGDDFTPPHRDAYPSDARFDPVPARQLAFDRSVLSLARQRDLPVFGICYGMQLLAVDQGGALHYHLPSDLPRANEHELPESDGRHALEIAPGTLLAGILGAGEHTVNSLHHQAVATPGPGLRTSATAPDGVIEAIEPAEPGQPFALGVQWHPEKLPGAACDELFGAFVEACNPGSGSPPTRGPGTG